ncbi:hypothetical protein NQZ68_025170 [Dissostichus eleginoides]|nr:hypothetical protein NQZ68_025170 [Dissostichus eleginoides]
MNLTDCDDAFMKQRELLFLPLIYKELIQGPEDNSFYNSSVPEMLPPPPHPPPSPPLLLIARTNLSNHHQFLLQPRPPYALLDFQIQRYFIPAPPHLCNHQQFLRKPIH